MWNRKSTLLIIEIAILVVIIGISAYLIGLQASKTKRLESEINRLQALNNDLQALNSDLRAKVSIVQELPALVTEYFRIIGKDCQVGPENISDLSGCIKNQIKIIKNKPKLGSGGFLNAFPPRPGAVIVKNESELTLDSSKFKLYLNHELQDNDGCVLKGEIPPGYTCKLNFYKTCQMGDVFEIEYDGQIILNFPC
jgi:hypothetical protein